MEFTNILGEKITLGNKPGEVKNRKVLDNAPRVEYSPDKPDWNSLSSDGACNNSSSSNGMYRIVDNSNNNELIRSITYTHATNNIMEFLGLVNAIKIANDFKKWDTVYTDSITAISWVRKGHCNTNLEVSPTTEPILAEIRLAEEYLRTTDLRNILVSKWLTKEWGIEIPADFGNKKPKH